MSVAALGTVLQRSDGASPPAFTPIAKVQTITAGAITVNTADVTTHDDTVMKIVPTIVDYGEVTISGQFAHQNATQRLSDSTSFANDAINKTERDFRLVWVTDGAGITTWGFSGYVTSAGPFEAAHDGSLTFEATIKVNTAYTEF